MLVHLFIERIYAETEIVFIRHTQKAEEVDEETFFYAQQTGGTIVSSALEKMRDIIADCYSTDEWNIYEAQDSDGENFSRYSTKCADLLTTFLLPVSQYYAYVEIIPEREKELLTNAEVWANFGNLIGVFNNVGRSSLSRGWQTEITSILYSARCFHQN